MNILKNQPLNGIKLTHRRRHPFVVYRAVGVAGQRKSTGVACADHLNPSEKCVESTRKEKNRHIFNMGGCTYYNLLYDDIIYSSSRLITPDNASSPQEFIYDARPFFVSDPIKEIIKRYNSYKRCFCHRIGLMKQHNAALIGYGQTINYFAGPQFMQIPPESVKCINDPYLRWHDHLTIRAVDTYISGCLKIP